MWRVINICFLCNVKRLKDIVALYCEFSFIKTQTSVVSTKKDANIDQSDFIEKNLFKILQIRFYNRPKDNTEYLLVLSKYLIQFIQF